MLRMLVTVSVLAVCATASRASAQCQRGGGSTGTATTQGSALQAASGQTASLLQGPGSLAAQMAQAAQMRQQLIQLQIMRAQMQAAERAASLEKRRSNAVKSQAETVARRERMRQFLASQSGQTRTDEQRRSTAGQVVSR